MNKSFTKAALAALLGGAVALSPTKAEELPKSEDLKKQIEENNKLLTTVQQQLQELKDLKEALYGRKDDKGFRIESDPGVIANLQRINDRVDDLRKQLETMKSQSLKPASEPGSTKITLPGTMPGGSGTLTPTVPGTTTPVPPSLGKGTLRLVNDYPVEISMVINEKQSYRVAPQSVQNIEVTAGDFTYQLLPAGGPPIKSTIKDKETVTLRIK